MPPATTERSGGPLRLVIDTNVWIRVLLGGRQTLPLLHAWLARQFVVVSSAALIAELEAVWQRPRPRQRISPHDAGDLLEQLRQRGTMTALTTIPPRCRDPRDQPVLATAIDGRADAIVTGDDDLRADDALREAMAQYGVELWGINTALARIGWAEAGHDDDPSP